MKKSFRPTKIASKRRRDLLNAEISCIRNLLPLTEIQRQRLSQIQVMSLCNAYVAINGFMADFCLKDDDGSDQTVNSTNLTQIFPGFILILSSGGQILYVSESIADHLGYTSLELLTQGDTVYDFIEAGDHSSLRMILETMSLPEAFSCCASQTLSLRMSVAQNFQSLYGYQHYRVMAVKGRVIRRPTKGSHCGGTTPQAIYVALVAPQSRSFLDSIDFPSFHSVHSLDMKFTEIDHSGSIWTGYNVDEVKSKSWYEMLHPDDVSRAKEVHLNLLQCQRQDGRPASLCVRIQTHYGHFIWIQAAILLHRSADGKLEISCSNCIVTDERARKIVRSEELDWVADAAVVCDGSGFKEGHRQPRRSLLADDALALDSGREGFSTRRQTTPNSCLRSPYPLLKAMLGRPTLRQLHSAAILETRSLSASFSSSSSSSSSLPVLHPTIDALLTPQNSPPNGARVHRELSHKDSGVSPAEIYASEEGLRNSGWEQKMVGQSGGWDPEGMAYSYCETPPVDRGDHAVGGLCSTIDGASSGFERDVETMPLDVIVDALKAMQDDPELYKEVEGLDLGVFSRSFPDLEKTKRNPFAPSSLDNPLSNVLLPYLNSTTGKLTHGQVETLNHRLFELKKAHERLVLEAVVETLHCGNPKRSELQDCGGLRKEAANL